MPRILIKGGVWKNTEDEILKAAVMKYGKNQWSRIASLLHRKTAKQCKARWFEWLDPEIKKTEWSREEEEKLLHLAKLMPTQWRTIAPIIGRTAAQCLEHYEKLLDQAQGGDGVASSDDPRRLRPGEIDPNPHTKPARPDQIDMDEDEKEMLSEARARLANTQGKKAKRKAREKQLEEARRLALLQKRRELRAAGIDTSRQRKRRRKDGIDYNAEIPFEKKAPKGFFDPSKDGTPASREFKPMSLEDARGGPSRDKVEEQKRREDKKRHEEQQKKDMPRAVMQMNKMTEEGSQRKRSKLVLPAPQTSDQELQDLVKLSATAEAVAALAAEKGANLLEDYTTTPAAALAATRTPRAPAHQDPLLLEAQNIIALNQTDSVLAGGENTPLAEAGGFEGLTPRHKPTATPNVVLSTPFRGATGTPGRTPDAGATPLRDKLSINSEGDSSLLTPRSASERRRQQLTKAELREGLANLPKPAADFEIVAPEIEEVDETEDVMRSGFVEDAADIDERTAAQRRADEEALFRRQTQVIQRGLPVPKEVNTSILRKSAPQNADQIADEIVKKEMLELIKRDVGLASTAGVEDYTEEEMKAAKELLAEEVAYVADAMGHASLDESHRAAWMDMQDEALYLPSEKRYGRFSTASGKDRLTSLELRYKKVYSAMEKDFKRGAKTEKKVTVLTTGYQKKSHASLNEMKALAEQIEESTLKLRSYERLAEIEAAAIPWRQRALEREVQQLTSREAELQAKYQRLIDERDALYSAASRASLAAATLSRPAEASA
eukprot:m.179009 g.179009  ORF g.179009 m.179009 type:complete len:779 (+) comp14664_c0_seq1:64-2400(+)